jgi:hypothetical protein
MSRRPASRYGIRAEGLASRVRELRQQGERMAASRAPRQGSTAPRSSCGSPCGSSAGVVASDRRSGLHRARPANRSWPDTPMVKAITRACRRPPGPAAPSRRDSRDHRERSAVQARRAGVVQCPASGSARVRTSEQRASWCLRIGIAMKLRPSSSSSRCCGVASSALSLSNPSKK